jgi:hypothetical protein
MPAYCVKCKGKRVMQNPTPTVLRSRKRVTHAVRGTCPVCRTAMFRIQKEG